MFRLNKKNAIRLHQQGPEKFKTIAELLKYFYNDSTISRNTYYVESGKIQCGANKMRSLHELTYLVKYYFPKETYKKIITEIVTYKHDYNRNTYFLCIYYCGDIRSPNVFMSSSGYTIRNYILKPRGILNYSWNDVFKYIGLTYDQIKEIQLNK